MVSLYPLKEFKYPIIAECINPDVFSGKTLEEIRALKIWEGNEQKNLGELFKAEENKTEDTTIAIHGDVSKVSTHDLKNALDEILSGKDVTVKNTKSFGCSIKRSS